jgi:hypothetical protein
MSTSIVHEAVLDEKIWRAWLQKGKLGEQATARKARLVALIALVAAAGSAFFLFAVR